ncbi:hypothetical protein KIH86_10700 [Paenibacillus sp. HN-1]|uniref:hypothetical protein n=1 Tax=Paenibacillus TaxID=44249 RepID=UPI001CAA097A|nr:MULTISPECIES: hypothetical protein [Paenibacillus]MBY9077122.1 hypothetical protein [Paenibacillus sp. CGMCC 1.18879]MBY9084693.1 hypothetical protein [Paenibacillus sinensis]
MVLSVIGVSRRGGKSNNHVQYVSADLLNKDDLHVKLSDLTAVTRRILWIFGESHLSLITMKMERKGMKINSNDELDSYLNENFSTKLELASPLFYNAEVGIRFEIGIQTLLSLMKSTKSK